MTSLEESSSVQIDELRAELERCVKNKDWTGVEEAVQDVPVPEIADAFLELEKADRALVFHALPREIGAELFAYMDVDRANRLMRDLGDEDTREVLANLAPDDRTQLLEELPGQVTQRLLNLLDDEDLKETRQLLGYPEESVGRLMTPDYVAVRPEWTIEKALRHIRKLGPDSELIGMIYVTDDKWGLIDAIELRELILANPEDPVSSVMDESFVSLSAFDDQEEAVHAFARYDKIALPVVDSKGVLLGIVTVDDVLDVAEEEATEDFHKAAAMSPLKKPYHESRVWMLFRKRIGWLLLLIVINLVSSGIIEAYEATLESIIALAFFIPLLIDSGGNTGSQSATVMVRALATGEVKMREWFRALGKELFVGLTLGLGMGLASSLLGWFRGDLALAVVVGLSMGCIVVVANLIGTMLPFVLTKFNVDPAVASSPLITSMADASGLFIYFGIATAFLNAGWLVGPEDTAIVIDCAQMAAETISCGDASYLLECVDEELVVECE